ncbi:MAG: chromate transporter [Gammaproteobacteria bacterium]|nr:chromate transporter [Gammaproteobacteria bacterium]
MARSVLALLLVFSPLSILSIGGGQATIPEMQHQAVVVHGWLTNGEFADLFAISRAAPGPSSLIAALIGWHVFGFWGAVAATLGMFLPSSLLMYAVGAWWHRRQDSPIRRAIERGLAPIAVGLVFAGAITILRAAHAGALVLATAAAVCLLQSTTRISTHATVGAVASIYLLLFYLG